MKSDFKSYRRTGLAAYSLIFISIAFVGIYLAIFGLLPKAEYFGLLASASFPNEVMVAIKAGNFALTVFWPAWIAIAIIAVAALLPLVPDWLRNCARAFVIFMAPVLAVFSGFLLCMSCAGYIVAYTALDMKCRGYELVLERIAVLDEANDVVEAAESNLAAIDHLKPLPPDKISQLPLREQKSRFRLLIGVLQTASSENAQKRVLATAVAFRSLVGTEPAYDEQIRAKSAQFAGVPFKNAQEALDWVASQKGAAGWEPVNLYEPQ